MPIPCVKIWLTLWYEPSGANKDVWQLFLSHSGQRIETRQDRHGPVIAEHKTKMVHTGSEVHCIPRYKILHIFIFILAL